MAKERSEEQQTEPCPRCKGRGTVKIKEKTRHADIYETCTRCGGSGEVKIKKSS